MKEPVPFEDVEYKKSNFLIGAKYKSSLLENKILAVSLTKVRKDESGQLISTVTASELKKYMKKTNGSFYDQLYSCADNLTNRQIVMEDRENHKFMILNIVQTALYDNGKFTIKYNSDLEKYLYGLQQNFTKLSLPVMMSFKSVYSFRLYELLKSKAYYPRDKKQAENLFRITFSLSELKLDLGAVNSSYDRVQRVLKGSSPDYDKAVEAAKEKTFARWGDFKDRVIDVAVNEINSMPEACMNVSYELGKAGRGGKVYEVSFIVKLTSGITELVESEVVIAPVVTADMGVVELIDDLLENEDMRVKDIKAIAVAAENDFELVKNAYEIYQKQKVKAANFTGWMIAAIKNGYKDSKKYTRNSFHDFEQNEYDFNQLELQLVSN
jgi:Protein involved in initiation of plasmid replication